MESVMLRETLKRTASALSVLAFMLFTSSLVYGETVGKIEVEVTSKDASQEAIEQMVLGTVATRVGDEAKPAVLAKDIERLIKSGKLMDARVKTEAGADGRLVVRYIVRPKPMVVNILLQGNTVYNSNRIKKLIGHEVGVLLDDTQLAADRSAILEKYRKAGYFGTTVVTRTAPSEGRPGVDVIFIIKEELRVKLRKVFFKNNTAYTEGELRNEIMTKRQWWRYIFRFGNYYNEQLLALDKDKLARLYGKKGYMDFAVTEVRQQKVDDDKWMEVTFVLSEGSPYTIGTITAQGMERFKEEELLKAIASKPGDVHNTEREELDINIMKALYDQFGYLDLRIYPVYKKDTEKHTVDVTFRVSEGKSSSIRNIDIVGNTVTKDEVIRRELLMAPGEMGNLGKIRISTQRIKNLGFFDKVEILPAATDVPDLRDLRIELKEKPTGQVSLGAGFSSEDSAIGFVEFQETNFDLMKLLTGEWPPKGDGQKLRARIQVGADVSNISISHTEPWFLDRRLELNTDFFLRNRFEDEYDQRNIGMGMMLSWPFAFELPFSNGHVEQWRSGVGFRIESIRISDVDEHDESKAMEKGDFVKDHILAEEEDTYIANRLIWRLTRDTRNAYIFPNRGSRIVLQSELVTSAFGSYETYGKFELGATKYIPAFRDFILKLDADYSTTTGDKAAIFDRYFGGGIGTIRGFKRRDVSPVDCYEDPLGGNSMFTASIELIKPVKNFMFVSTFIDAGNSWWDDFNMDLGDLNYSVGVGVQFRALPVSIYYGIPISTTYDHLDGKSGRLHFNIGLTF